MKEKLYEKNKKNKIEYWEGKAVKNADCIHC
jgi:hypothetical protein